MKLLLTHHQHFAPFHKRNVVYTLFSLGFFMADYTSGKEALLNVWLVLSCWIGNRFTSIISDIIVAVLLKEEEDENHTTGDHAEQHWEVELDIYLWTSDFHIFTVGEAVRSTCGNSHEEKEEKENRFHLSLLQTML